MSCLSKTRKRRLHFEREVLERLERIEKKLDFLIARFLTTRVTAELAITDLTLNTTVTVPIEGDTKVMSNAIKDDSKGVSYALVWGNDADGNPGSAPALPSLPAWSEDSNGALITLTPAADGMSATAVPTGKGLGTVNVTCVVPASTDGVFPGATVTDALPIIGDEASSVTLSSTPIS